MILLSDKQRFSLVLPAQREVKWQISWLRERRRCDYGTRFPNYLNLVDIIATVSPSRRVVNSSLRIVEEGRAERVDSIAVLDDHARPKETRLLFKEAGGNAQWIKSNV